MVNPIITNKSKETILWEEACISLPGCIGMVKRHKSIHVEFSTPEGEKQKKKYKDFNAVIIQHEIDHLDGVLFMDKVEPEKKKKVVKKK
jgi:peptide deformylase